MPGTSPGAPFKDLLLALTMSPARMAARSRPVAPRFGRHDPLVAVADADVPLAGGRVIHVTRGLSFARGDAEVAGQSPPGTPALVA